MLTVRNTLKTYRIARGAIERFAVELTMLPPSRSSVVVVKKDGFKGASGYFTRHLSSKRLERAANELNQWLAAAA
jgi:hypothetical protein